MSRVCLLSSIMCILLSAHARAGASPDLSFDLLGDAARPAAPGAALAEAGRAEAVQAQARHRRRMLLAHQVLGFAALGALGAATVLGHLNYADKYTSGEFSTRYERPHLGLSVSTAALFGATGLLGVVAPNPYPKALRFDTALVHKAAMCLATAGMAAQIVLGPLTAARVGRRDQADLALAHVITGYATFGFMATGVVAYFF